MEFVSIHVVTTGSYPGRHQILEFGAVRGRTDCISNPRTMPKFARRLRHYGEYYVSLLDAFTFDRRNAISIPHLIEEFQHWLPSVEYNAAFTEETKGFLEAIPDFPKWKREILDSTYRITCRALKGAIATDTAIGRILKPNWVTM